MKIQDYGKGENSLSVNSDPYADSFGVLWPFNRAVTVSDSGWIKYNPKVVNNRVINRMAASLVDVLLSYCEEFYPEKKLTIEMGQWIATTSGKERDLVFQLCLAGEDKTPQLSDECSEILRYLVSKLQESQAQLDFGTKGFALEPAKLAFLDAHVSAIRQDFSGREIQQPFGIETCGRNREITSFRERFDVYAGEHRPPQPISGMAVVDGFCDSENAVLLKLLNEMGETEERPLRFIVVSAKLIDLAINARLQQRFVEFYGNELYVLGAKKPTFHLEELKLGNLIDPE